MSLLSESAFIHVHAGILSYRQDETWCPALIMVIILSLLAIMCTLIIVSGAAAMIGTQIGEKGKKDSLLRCSINITASVLAILISFMCLREELMKPVMAAAVAATGAIVLICGIITIKKTLAETDDDLVTEELSEVNIIHIGFNHKVLEGTVNGGKRRFSMFGADKDIAKMIANRKIKQITVTYHTSDNRIEAIH